MENKKQYWSIFGILCGVIGLIVDTIQGGQMIINSTNITIPVSLVFAVLLALGLAYLVKPIYSYYKKLKSKKYNVPFEKAALYLEHDSILSTPCKQGKMVSINALKQAAHKGIIKVYGLNVETNEYQKIPKKFFSSEYSFNGKALYTSADAFSGVSLEIKKVGSKNAIYTAMIMSQDDLIFLWPPHSQDFELPSSWKYMYRLRFNET